MYSCFAVCWCLRFFRQTPCCSQSSLNTGHNSVMAATYKIAGDEKLQRLMDDFEIEPQSRRNNLSKKYVWFLHSVFLITSILFYIRGYIYSQPTTLSYVNKFSTYSPAAQAVRYSDVLFNDTVASSPPSSSYIGQGRAVDEAWNALTEPADWSFLINEKQLWLLEKPKETRAKSMDEKTGERGLKASLEVFWQLRCLDTVRKATYPDSADEAMAGMEAEGLASKSKPNSHRSEVDRCLEMIRTNLMCTADIGLVTYEAGKDGSASAPDFASWHTCRNFDGIVRWTKENAMRTSAQDLRQAHAQ